MSKYLLLNADGVLQEDVTVQASVGINDADRIPSLNSEGILSDSIVNSSSTSEANKVVKMNNQGIINPEILNATPVSAGDTDANKIVQLNSSGKIDESFLPAGIKADTVTLPAGENLVAGDFVTIRDVAGTATIFKANAATKSEAYGYVIVPVTSGAQATMYFEGNNSFVTGLMAGPIFLSATAGIGTATPPSATGNIVQLIGFSTGLGVNFAYSRGVENS